MSPTIFREGPFRFFFFSREESRAHVHVSSPDGEAKYWLEPVALAVNYRLASRDLTKIEGIIVARKEEILHAWHRHFESGGN